MKSALRSPSVLLSLSLFLAPSAAHCAAPPAGSAGSPGWLFINRVPPQPAPRPSALTVSSPGTAAQELSAALAQLKQRCPECRLPDGTSLEAWLATPFFKKLASEPFYKDAAKELLLENGVLKAIRFSHQGRTYTVVPGEQNLYAAEAGAKQRPPQVLALKEDGTWAPVDMSHPDMGKGAVPQSRPSSGAFDSGLPPAAAAPPVPASGGKEGPPAQPPQAGGPKAKPAPPPNPGPAPAQPTPAQQRINTILARIQEKPAELKSGRDLDNLLEYVRTPDPQNPGLRARVADALVAGFHKNEGYLWNSGTVRQMGAKIRGTLTGLLQERGASVSDPTLPSFARSFMAMKPSKDEVRAVLNGPATAGRLQLAALLAADPAARETYKAELGPILRQTLTVPKDQSPFKDAEYDQARQAAVRALADPTTIPGSWIPWRSERRESMAGELLKAVREAPTDYRLLHAALGAISRNRAFYSKAENWQAGADILDAVLQAPAPSGAGASEWAAIQAQARALKGFICDPSKARDPGQNIPRLPAGVDPQPASPPQSPRQPSLSDRTRVILSRMRTNAPELMEEGQLDTVLAFLKSPGSEDPELRIQAIAALQPVFRQNEGWIINSIYVNRAGRKIRSAYEEILRDPDRAASDPILQPVARSLLAMNPWRSQVRGILSGQQTAGRLQLASVLAANPDNYTYDSYHAQAVPALLQTATTPRPQAGSGTDYERQAAVRALMDPVTLPSSWIPWRSERRMSDANEVMHAVMKAPGDRQLMYYALESMNQNRSFYVSNPAGKGILDAVLKAQAPAGDARWTAVQAWARVFRSYLDYPSSLPPAQDIPMWP